MCGDFDGTCHNDFGMNKHAHVAPLGLIRVVCEFMECLCSMLVSPATCQHRAGPLCNADNARS